MAAVHRNPLVIGRWMIVCAAVMELRRAAEVSGVSSSRCSNAFRPCKEEQSPSHPHSPAHAAGSPSFIPPSQARPERCTNGQSPAPHRDCIGRAGVRAPRSERCARQATICRKSGAADHQQAEAGAHVEPTAMPSLDYRCQLLYEATRLRAISGCSPKHDGRRRMFQRRSTQYRLQRVA